MKLGLTQKLTLSLQKGRGGWAILSEGTSWAGPPRGTLCTHVQHVVAPTCRNSRGCHAQVSLQSDTSRGAFVQISCLTFCCVTLAPKPHLIGTKGGPCNGQDSGKKFKRPEAKETKGDWEEINKLTQWGRTEVTVALRMSGPRDSGYSVWTSVSPSVPFASSYGVFSFLPMADVICVHAGSMAASSTSPTTKK